MQSSLILGVCIVVCLVGLLTAQCHRYDVNGCSIPYDLPYFYKQSFAPSCDKHDVCYECGAVKGIAKTTCDIKLYHDIKAVCASHGVGRRDVDKRSVISQFCNLVSVSYYEAVKHFGAGYFSTVSPSWCSESWVRGCLP